MDGTIILIDHSSYERQKIKHILEKIGNFDCVEVSTLNQFKLLNLNLNNLLLIIIDISFPAETDGFEVLSVLQNNKATAKIPVIVVTRSDSPEHKATALHYSVNDYIVKPYQVKRLESSIRSFIRLKDSFHYDTGGIGGISMTFDDYIMREMKYSKRTGNPLSFILITTLKIKEDIGNKESVSSMTAEKARNCLRTTDTIFMSQTGDIIIVLPCTSESGAKLVCGKIKANLNDYIYPVHVTYPQDGEDFQALMELAFKKVSDKEMLEKMVSIPTDTRKYVSKSYNRFNRWP